MLKKAAIVILVSLFGSSAVFGTTLISLNIWGGNVKEPLEQFIRKHKNIDIFCFQEVYHGAKKRVSDDDNYVNLNIFNDMEKLLPNHKGYFLPIVGESYGIGMIISKRIKIIDHGSHTIHENLNYKGSGPTHSRKLQWIKCKLKEKTFYVVNVHGLWNGRGKTDSPERIEQANRIKSFVSNLDAPVVLCGDFNLRPDTKSIQIISENKNNLVKEYNIRSTRTVLYTKPERHADYIFTSSNIKVNKFKVLSDVVSDHSPLLLDFTLPSV